MNIYLIGLPGCGKTTLGKRLARELKYECNCSKERFERGLRTLKEEDLEDILNTDHKCEITCNFCNKKYVFDENDLKNIILSLKK